MPRRLLALGSAVAVGGALALPAASQVSLEATSCQPCHEQIVATFLQTAHVATSAEATARSIKGRFVAGHNVLRTRSPGVSFTMEQRNGVFYQTGVDSTQGRSITRRIDLVVGSGRRGQSYLYWSGGLLFELPVSYLTGPEQWINSPGYSDGVIDFGRLIVPRCLECHSTTFPLQTERGAMRYSRRYRLGISCEKCHGEGREHIRYQSSHPAKTGGAFILNPARFPRDRRVDTCALCHSGEGEPRRPSFSYRPGERLDDYVAPQSGAAAPLPDVHGDQVGLLRRSKCFRASPDMSCATCHDVHRPERDIASFAETCLACHQTDQHPMAAAIAERMLTSCIDCHMPNRKSNAIQINSPAKPAALYFRSHEIGIYREATARVLRSNRE
jgi:cytochrome c554/c'-like protein